MAEKSDTMKEALLKDKLKKAAPPPASTIKDDFTNLQDAASKVQQLRLSAQKELEQSRIMRAEAQRYQQETATKARSEAQHFILRTRLATQREIEEMIRKASEEIQKMLADIRVIRITAQEELAAQKKFNDAARLHFMSLSMKEEEHEKPERKRKKQVIITD